MNSTNQVTFPYDLDGIKFTIIADVTPGEPMTMYSPKFEDEIESIKLTGVVEISGKKFEYNVPELMVGEMRKLWGLDDLIMDEIKEIRKFNKSMRRIS